MITCAGLNVGSHPQCVTQTSSVMRNCSLVTWWFCTMFWAIESLQVQTPNTPLIMLQWSTAFFIRLMWADGPFYWVHICTLLSLRPQQSCQIFRTTGPADWDDDSGHLQGSSQNTLTDRTRFVRLDAYKEKKTIDPLLLGASYTGWEWTG